MYDEERIARLLGLPDDKEFDKLPRFKQEALIERALDYVKVMLEAHSNLGRLLGQAESKEEFYLYIDALIVNAPGTDRTHWLRIIMQADKETDETTSAIFRNAVRLNIIRRKQADDD